jgi:membrane fusion protein (multidrug efflux system)
MAGLVNPMVIGGNMRQLSCAAILLMVSLLATSCGNSRPASAAAPSTTQPAASVAAAAPADDSFLASGPLVVENQVDVAAQREGMVARTLAEPGTAVRKGQLLAVLDDRQVTAEHDAAAAKVRAVEANLKNWEAEAEVLKADLERSEKMWEAQLITKQQLDHDRYKLVADQYEVERERQELLNARARLRSLELETEKTRILAPFNGVVARRYVRVGQKVALGDRLFWVTSVAPLRVKFTLPERFLGRLQVGELISVSSADEAAATHRAKVIQVSPVVDPSSGTIEVMAELIGPAGGLRPGMTANVRIQGRR